MARSSSSAVRAPGRGPSTGPGGAAVVAFAVMETLSGREGNSLQGTKPTTTAVGGTDNFPSPGPTPPPGKFGRPGVWVGCLPRAPAVASRECRVTAAAIRGPPVVATHRALLLSGLGLA